MLRPSQPSDTRPLPVLVDGHTASAAATGGRLALTVDGQPVNAHVVGVLRRFPTVAASAAGFVVADEATLAGALDAQMPGQGAADGLWISSSGPRGRCGPRCATAPLSRLNRSFRADIEHGCRSRRSRAACSGTLLAAAALAIALAVLGLLVTLLGASRDERVQRDLVVQGVGPRGLRRELRLRLLLAGVLGTVVGLGVAVLLTRLAVASVRAAGTVAVPRPGLVTVAPWGELAVWGWWRSRRSRSRAGWHRGDRSGMRSPNRSVRLREVFCVHRTNEGDAAALQGTNLDLGAANCCACSGPAVPARARCCG